MNKTAALLSVLFLVIGSNALAAPKASPWSFWEPSNETSQKQIDHRAWGSILNRHLATTDNSGINRFRYGNIKKKDSRELDAYLKSLSKIDPRDYNRREQKAYWINLYNALVVQLVIKNYPVKSITHIGGSFRSGPWEKDLIRVAGKKLSLNDIEHRIIRPIWKDHKIHFGLHCAGLSCPHLQPVAFTGKNVDTVLKKAGKEYINHPRGVHLKNGQMKASSIFDWYGEDFAKNEKDMLKLFAYYADDKLALYLLGFQGDIQYEYDWALNH